MLIWWAMIQAVVFYGWGLGRSALYASHFWGMVCSSRSCDRNILRLTVDLNEQRTCYLSRLSTMGFITDNYVKSASIYVIKVVYFGQLNSWVLMRLLLPLEEIPRHTEDIAVTTERTSVVWPDGVQVGGGVEAFMFYFMGSGDGQF